MENHNFLLKLSRLFPSSFTSCQARTRPDVVADSSVSIAKSKKIPRLPSHSPLSQKHPKPVSNSCSSHLSASHSTRWFTSSDTDTFYSMSSNSGDSFREKKSGTGCEPGSDHASTRTYYDGSGCRRRRNRPRGVIEEGVVVEKESRDPYGDFMRSTVEMIVEKQMFGEEDLDRLLCCYLSLNKKEYHGIILQVFYQICQTLLCR